jgi:hypothetical protein
VSITDALAKNLVAGVLSYHIIDNPVYRDAFPFADSDIPLIRKHGLAAVTKMRTVGKSKTGGPDYGGTV